MRLWGFLPFEKQLFYFIIWRLFAGCSALRHGDSEARAAGLLQGSGSGGRAGGCGVGGGVGWGGCPSRAVFMLPSFLPQGLVPAGIRLMPHTVLTFVFLEQLRKHFGIKVPS